MRVIPRTEIINGNPELILFFPDDPANYGNIACWAHMGEHAESSIEYYLTETKPCKDTEHVKKIIEGYKKRYHCEDIKFRIMKRCNR